MAEGTTELRQMFTHALVETCLSALSIFKGLG